MSQGGDREGTGVALPWPKPWVLWSSTPGRAEGAQGISCCSPPGLSMGKGEVARKALARTAPPEGKPRSRFHPPFPKLSLSFPGVGRLQPSAGGIGAVPAAKFPLAQGFASAFQDLFVLNHLPNKVRRRLL